MTRPTTARPFDPVMAEEVALLADHMNAAYPDTVTLVARWALAADEISSAAIVAVDPAGLDFDVVDRDGPRRGRMTFEWPATDVDAVQVALLAALTTARQAFPNDPPTSLEQAYAEADAQPIHSCSVLAVHDLTPSLRQVTVGPLPAFVSRGFDQAVTLFVPQPGRPVPAELTYTHLQQLPVTERPRGATYTIRRFDLENRTADIWVMLHGGAGTIGGWAAGDVVGEPVALWGPRGQFALPDGTTSLLLVCDETALGAVAAIIDDTDPRLPVHVVAEVADARHAVDLPGGPRTTVTWVFRGHDEPGTGTRLLDVVRDLDLDVVGVFAFGAAEARQIMAVRRHLRNERGLPAAQVDMGGYWRRDG